MKVMSPMDSLFLIGESREHPLHVGGLQVFTPPQGAGPEFVRDTYEAMLACGESSRRFRKHPATAFGGFINVAWTFDDDIDLDYHVRRSALPAPGRVRELLELTSRLHSGLLDRHRPLWESHVIESPADGRFAVYTKVHHALVDGVSALKLMQRSLSTDPADSEIRVPWALPPRPREPCEDSSGRGAKAQGDNAIGGAEGPIDAGTGACCAGRAGAYSAVSGTAHDAERSDRWGAPVRGAILVAGTHRGGQKRGRGDCQRRCSRDVRRCLALLSQRPQRAARFAADRHGSGQCAHRARLGGGNVVSTVLCDLATHLDDPASTVGSHSPLMQENKKVLSQLPRAQAMAVGMATFTMMFLGGLPRFSCGAAAVQHLHLQHPRPPRAGVLQRGAPRRQLSAFGCHGWAGTQHHRGELR